MAILAGNTLRTWVPQKGCAAWKGISNPELVAGLRLGRSMPAVFFDRDGVVNVERGHIASEDDVEVYRRCGRSSQVAEEMQATSASSLPINQSSPEANAVWTTLQRIHGRIDMLLGRSGAYFDAWYCCPHHPDRGFPGEVQILKISAIAGSQQQECSSNAARILTSI